MHHSLIEHFTQSIRNLFSTMLQMEVTPREPIVQSALAHEGDVSGVIGLTGDLVGSVVLSLPGETATRVVSRFTGESITDTRDEICTDAIAEMVNMIAGGAKGRLTGLSVFVSSPSVIVGESHTVRIQKGIPCAIVHCDSECGPFTIEIAIQNTTRAVASRAPSTTRAMP
ncbi:MAG: chemotaxis protein CheX [Phycisphaerales bacterium JB043]